MTRGWNETGKCIICGDEISEGEEYCESCRKELYKSNDKQKISQSGMLIGIAAISVPLLCIGVLTENWILVLIIFVFDFVGIPIWGKIIVSNDEKKAEMAEKERKERENKRLLERQKLEQQEKEQEERRLAVSQIEELETKFTALFDGISNSKKQVHELIGLMDKITYEEKADELLKKAPKEFVSQLCDSHPYCGHNFVSREQEHLVYDDYCKNVQTNDCSHYDKLTPHDIGCKKCRMEYLSKLEQVRSIGNDIYYCSNCGNGYVDTTDCLICGRKMEGVNVFSVFRGDELLCHKLILLQKRLQKEVDSFVQKKQNIEKNASSFTKLYKELEGRFSSVSNIKKQILNGEIAVGLIPTQLDAVKKQMEDTVSDFEMLIRLSGTISTMGRSLFDNKSIHNCVEQLVNQVDARAYEKELMDDRYNLQSQIFIFDSIMKRAETLKEHLENKRAQEVARAQAAYYRSQAEREKAQAELAKAQAELEKAREDHYLRREREQGLQEFFEECIESLEQERMQRSEQRRRDRQEAEEREYRRKEDARRARQEAEEREHRRKMEDEARRTRLAAEKQQQILEKQERDRRLKEEAAERRRLRGW